MRVSCSNRGHCSTALGTQFFISLDFGMRLFPCSRHATEDKCMAMPTAAWLMANKWMKYIYKWNKHANDRRGDAAIESFDYVVRLPQSVRLIDKKVTDVSHTARHSKNEQPKDLIKCSRVSYAFQSAIGSSRQQLGVCVWCLCAEDIYIEKPTVKSHAPSSHSTSERIYRALYRNHTMSPQCTGTSRVPCVGASRSPGSTANIHLLRLQKSPENDRL